MDFAQLKERMQSGKIYFDNDESLRAEQLACLEILYDYNQTRPTQQKEREEILRRLLAEMGENCYIEPPLRTNWGCHTHLGNNFYANFNLTLVDDGDIFIGNNVMIAPNVIIDTATHPIDPELRRKTAQYNLPVRIEDNVWIGAGAILLPGVTIGENSVIGAGSVVTKDIPPNVVAVGTPCRVLRPITDQDKKYYHKGWPIDL